MLVMRLRKDRALKKDALEAGFEGSSAPRMSRVFPKPSSGSGISEFDPRDFLETSGISGSMIEYSTPPAGRGAIHRDYSMTVSERRPKFRPSLSGHDLQAMGPTHQYSTTYSKPRPIEDLRGAYKSQPEMQLDFGTPTKEGNITPTQFSQRRSVANINNHRQITTLEAHGSKTLATPTRPHDHRHLQRETILKRVLDFFLGAGGYSDRRPSATTASGSSGSGPGNGRAVGPPNYHSYAEPQHRHNDVHFTREVLVDAPPKVANNLDSIEQRLRNLEIAQTKHVVVPVEPSPSMGIRRFDADGSDKDQEIAGLKKQLRQLHTKLESEQKRHQDNMNVQRDQYNVTIKEVKRLKDSLMTMEEELLSYREVAAISNDYQEVGAMQQKLRDLERLNIAQRQDLLSVELQRDDLLGQLDFKDKKLKDLSKELETLKAEHSSYGQSCSSGSTPIVDDLEAATMGGSVTLTDATPICAGDMNGRRAYKKAHSTMTPIMRGSNGHLSGSPYGGSTVTSIGHGALRKSHSNYQIGQDTPKGEVAPVISSLIRSQTKHVLEAVILTRALAEVAHEVENGNNASLSDLMHLQASAVDSMSESEAENLVADSTPMTIEEAQRKMTKQQRKMAELTKDLDDVSRTMREMYTRRLEEMKERDEYNICRVQ
ncbi:unnamed protein product, partial [Mesorhabditis spiculigera]